MNYQSTAVLKDRVAVVTGGAGGIGLETTKAMLAQGATVVISDIDTAKGESAAKELGIEFFATDLTRSAEVSELANYVLEQHGRIDVAFNNAGIAHSVPGEECTDDHWLRVININLNAVFYCCREFGKAMLAQGRGSIINTASMSGIISNNPQPQCAYNATKAGVIMLTKSLAGEWAQTRSPRQQYFAGLCQHADDTKGSNSRGLVQDLDGVLADGPNRRTARNRSCCRISGFGCKQLFHRQQLSRRRRVHVLVKPG